MSLKLIVALDFDNKTEALRLVDAFDPVLCALKVGSELFTRFGPEFVRQLLARQFKVFLDLKFHDIPNTVQKACKAAADLGVWMLNVHALGGLPMMQAAKEALNGYGSDKPLLIAVTLLTSFGQKDLLALGTDKTLANQVLHLARLAKDSGLDGVVCSAQEVQSIKNTCGNEFLAITPGIRFADSPSQDQVRIRTPKEALLQGSDFLVVGRPITQAKDPLAALHEVIRTIEVLE